MMKESGGEHTERKMKYIFLKNLVAVCNFVQLERIKAFSAEVFHVSGVT